jgi:hypothetical protein
MHITLMRPGTFSAEFFSKVQLHNESCDSGVNDGSTIFQYSYMTGDPDPESN